jgi:hypothetical protein
MDLGSDATRLPGSPPVAAKIRKRRKIGVIRPVLDNDPDHGDAVTGPDDGPVLGVKVPPPFFASSSQSEAVRDNPAPISSEAPLPHQGGKGPKSSKAKGKRKAVDDEERTKKSEAKPKPKARRKKDRKLNDDETPDPINKLIGNADVGQGRSEDSSVSTEKDIPVPQSVAVALLTGNFSQFPSSLSL